jgi:hypothetical protein
MLPTEYAPISKWVEADDVVNPRQSGWRINIDCVILFWVIIYIFRIFKLRRMLRFLIWGLRRGFGLLKWLLSFLRRRLLGLISLLNKLGNPSLPIAHSWYFPQQPPTITHQSSPPLTCYLPPFTLLCSDM